MYKIFYVSKLTFFPLSFTIFGLNRRRMNFMKIIVSVKLSTIQLEYILLFYFFFCWSFLTFCPYIIIIIFSILYFFKVLLPILAHFRLLSVSFPFLRVLDPCICIYSIIKVIQIGRAHV